MAVTPIEIIVMLVGLIFAYGAFSFVWFPGNLLYDIAESVAIGGYCLFGLFTVIDTIWATFLVPIGQGTKIFLIIPVITGILVFSRWTKYRWMARYPVAVSSGVGLGVLFAQTIRADILTQLQYSITDAITGNPDLITGWLMAVVLACVIVYYTFSKTYSSIFYERGSRGWWISRIARLAMYAAFGFGYQAIFVNEGLGDFVNTLMALVRRPIDALIGA
jgi:hypothetical protein